MQEKLRFSFGQQLKKIRQRQNMTQEDLADLAKIDYKYLQKIEGKNPPNVSLRIIERLAIALKVQPVKLFDF